jgi:hypothetical protein
MTLRSGEWAMTFSSKGIYKIRDERKIQDKGFKGQRSRVKMSNDKAQSSNECQMTKSKVQIWHLSFDIWILIHEPSNPIQSMN